MIRNRLLVNGSTNSVTTKYVPTQNKTVQAKQAVTSNFIPATSGVPISVGMFGGPSYTTMFNGILPEGNETLLNMYYRDCYYYDSVAGSCVDIISNFPFSEFTLTGLESEELEPFAETVARLNVRALTQEISNAYLVDGAFAGSLIYDPKNKVFQDILVHDAANITVTPQPFYSIDPAITVNSANSLNQFLNSGSPYINEVLQHYPQGLLDTFRAGNVVLDPLATVYIPRRGAQDKTSVSYLKRILPAYMLEKVLYRGTLTELSKRQRSTSHIKVGDDVWEPTNQEMANVLNQFQQTEMDPLGAWIITRNGVDVNEIRPGGEFFKWTDIIDTMVPYKLRALGISEAFLSGDASYSTAEAALTVFMDNMDSYRQFITYKLFTSKIFPLIAMFHGLYRDAKKARPPTNSANIFYNMNDQKNLKVPGVRWHKSLEGNQAESQFDMLEKLSEKGFVIPLKMWAAAAQVDITMLMRDLKEDKDIRDSIEKVTGKPAEDQGMGAEDANNMDEGMGGYEQARLRAKASGTNHPGSYPGSVKAVSKRVGLLDRDFTSVVDGKMAKSGTHVKAIYSEGKAKTKLNEMIAKASEALQDPNRRMAVRKQVAEKLGNKANMGLFRGTLK